MIRSFFLFTCIFFIPNLLFAQTTYSRTTVQGRSGNSEPWKDQWQHIHDYDDQGNLILILNRNTNLGTEEPVDYAVTEYTYDKNGNRLTEARKVNNGNGVFIPTKFSNYEYNEVGLVIKSSFDKRELTDKDNWTRTENTLHFNDKNLLITHEFTEEENGVLIFSGSTFNFYDENCNNIKTETIYDNSAVIGWSTWKYSAQSDTVTFILGNTDLNLNQTDTFFVQLTIYDETGNKDYIHSNNYRFNIQSKTYLIHNDKNQRISEKVYSKQSHEEEFIFVFHDTVVFTYNQNEQLILREEYKLSEEGELSLKETKNYDYFCDGDLKSVVTESFVIPGMSRQVFEYQSVKSCEFNNHPLGFTVSPNPSSEFVNIDFLDYEFEKILLRLFSIDGKLVFEKNISHPQRHIVLNAQSIPKGMYILEVNDGVEKETKKVIISP